MAMFARRLSSPSITVHGAKSKLETSRSFAVELALLLVAPRARESASGTRQRVAGSSCSRSRRFALGFLAHMQEQLHHHVAVVGQLALEVAHRRGVAARLVAQRRGLVRGVGHHALHRRAVPPAIEKRDGAALAERLPVLLHERMEVGDAVRLAGKAAQRGLIDVLRDVNARRAGVEVVHQIRDPLPFPAQRSNLRTRRRGRRPPSALAAARPPNAPSERRASPCTPLFDRGSLSNSTLPAWAAPSPVRFAES